MAEDALRLPFPAGDAASAASSAASRSDRWLVEHVVASRFLEHLSSEEHDRVRHVLTAALADVAAAIERQSRLEMSAFAVMASVMVVPAIFFQRLADEAWWGGGPWWKTILRPIAAPLVVSPAAFVFLRPNVAQTDELGEGARSTRPPHTEHPPRVKAFPRYMQKLWVRLLIAAAFLALALRFALPLWPGGWLGLLFSGGIFLTWVVASAALAGLIAAPAERWFRAVRPDPRAELIVGLAWLFAVASDDVCLRSGAAPDDLPPRASRLAFWRVDTKARARLARELEYSARRAEQQMPRLCSWLLRDARSWLRGRAARIAAGFRAHVRALVLSNPDQDERLAPALAAELVAAVRGDWNELMRTEPGPLGRRLVAQWAPRVIVAGVLAAAAFMAPGLLSLDGDAATQLRGGLLAISVVALTGAPEAAIQKAAERLGGSS